MAAEGLLAWCLRVLVSFIVLFGFCEVESGQLAGKGFPRVLRLGYKGVNDHLARRSFDGHRLAGHPFVQLVD
ncbi:hypothetical protein PP336_11785 [Mycobacteroides abscessus]|uniref:hypothetical protein n=1 Tax=Mycobacteroides abscessus TaxID=36809 RepID=UPI0018782A4A|nr:hypothetical protein [Mycobacteroides abscessus]MDM1901340.1 hypothetical protein [Mycobacteroides abscessus]MDM1961127.1 hypothetical protein [Mycobacteroides abscessus]MDM1965721.1 hypothetical protein [Mycobacteroides abscessus]MDM1976368.1 hypothetical protein [Mycobacteroides abscessus]MDM1981060.1 hypothetical protein [Mycobacteroides abscessus]